MFYNNYFLLQDWTREILIGVSVNIIKLMYLIIQGLNTLLYIII